MGWTSNSDSMGDVDNAALWFHTREQAMAFAQKHGWEYEVLEPHQRRFERQKRFKGYGEWRQVEEGVSVWLESASSVGG